MQERDMILDSISCSEAIIRDYSNVISMMHSEEVIKKFKNIRLLEENFCYALKELAIEKGYLCKLNFVDEEVRQSVKVILNASAATQQGGGPSPIC